MHRKKNSTKSTRLKIKKMKFSTYYRHPVDVSDTGEENEVYFYYSKYLPIAILFSFIYLQKEEDDSEPSEEEEETNIAIFNDERTLGLPFNLYVNKIIQNEVNKVKR